MVAFYPLLPLVYVFASRLHLPHLSASVVECRKHSSPYHEPALFRSAPSLRVYGPSRSNDAHSYTIRQPRSAISLWESELMRCVCVLQVCGDRAPPRWHSNVVHVRYCWPVPRRSESDRGAGLFSWSCDDAWSSLGTVPGTAVVRAWRLPRSCADVARVGLSSGDAAGHVGPGHSAPTHCHRRRKEVGAESRGSLRSVEVCWIAQAGLLHDHRDVRSTLVRLRVVTTTAPEVPPCAVYRLFGEPTWTRSLPLRCLSPAGIWQSVPSEITVTTLPQIFIRQRLRRRGTREICKVGTFSCSSFQVRSSCSWRFHGSRTLVRPPLGGARGEQFLFR
jgi:hypothetical protein